ncbi:MAG: Rieske 2Fe-2S domain-containing protein [Acidobacteriota bacterium]|nr:Rieske 2Fe-2S domain-containing protein [Acidobacteriota bacterium]
MRVSDIPALRGYWYPVAYGHEVDDQPLQARLFGSPYVVWRDRPGGPVRAAVDECPHRAARLSQGWVDQEALVCPYHGWRFDAQGRCVTIPALDPATPITSRARLACVSAAERYGLVWLLVGDEREPIPDLTELNLGYTLIHELKEYWTASAPRMIDNALDVSHVAFVHRGTVGDPDAARLSDFAVEREGHRLRFEVTYKSHVRGTQVTNVGLAGVVTRTTEAELVQPFVFRGALVYETGLRHVLFKTCTPVDDETTLFFQFIGRNDDPPEEKWPDIIAVDRAVQAEDRLILEAIDADFPLDITSEVHTRADRMTVEYRRILAELAALGPPAPPPPPPPTPPPPGGARLPA